jgi:TRAP-type C4-dicarboxylate transport system permease small subunit
MNVLLNVVRKVSVITQVISGLFIIVMVLITLADVILRQFGMPIFGAYELISVLGGFVFGFGMPYTGWKRGQVYVDSAINTFPKGIRACINVVTRLISIALFLLISWNLHLLGKNFYLKHEVTSSIQFPYYPVAYAIAISMFLLCFVLAAEIIKVVRGEYE